MVNKIRWGSVALQSCFSRSTWSLAQLDVSDALSGAGRMKPAPVALAAPSTRPVRGNSNSTGV